MNIVRTLKLNTYLIELCGGGSAILPALLISPGGPPMIPIGPGGLFIDIGGGPRPSGGGPIRGRGPAIPPGG